MKVPKDRKVVLITGTSTGIGKALAEQLAGEGYRVYGTVRKPIETKAFPTIVMDVTDDKSVETGIKSLLEKEGRIDVLVNNAGMGIAGSVEETLTSEAIRQLDVNYFGVLRVVKRVLPGMRERRSGLILNVSSIGGIMGIPFQGHYTASKFALEGLSEVIHLEVSRLGIKVVVVEPGDVQTEFTAKRAIHEAHKNSHYPWFGLAVEAIVQDENQGLTPEFCADKIAKIIRKKNPRFRWVVSLPSQKFTVALYRLLPYRIFARILQRHKIR
jgi:short-subunit dehydrogenase